MFLLVSGATATVRRWPQVGELVVPGARNLPSTLRLEPGRWAMDNGAFAGFDEVAYLRMLERFDGCRGCLFVTAPDVVADARATLDRWPFWAKLLRGIGHRPALVLQDGMLAAEIPWREVGAIFVGGSDAWKFSRPACELVAYAKARGLWVHVGRINSRKRINLAAQLGVDSFDGGQYSRWPDQRIPEGVGDIAATLAQASLL